ncbi:MAG: acetolactate synthase small subunit [Planctomycetes bacterium]|nr:acetolactate synthase small subunit [Planctomycetota bacterium]
MKHTISCRVRNRPGVLARVAGLFSRRGYNIDSLAVSAAHQPGESRMTIVVEDAENIMGQIVQQLYKLIDVIQVIDHTGDTVVERELALLKIQAPAEKRMEILQLALVFRARAVDISEGAVVLEVTGSPDKIDAMERVMDPYGIAEMVRTGKVIVARGTRAT